LRFADGDGGLLLELAAVLTAIVGAGVAALKPESLVSSVVGGIVGNRADAAFVLGWQAVRDALKQGDAPIQQALQRAVWRSQLTALYSIAEDCRRELVGNAEQKYRGNPVYPPQHEADLRWLDQQLRVLKQDLEQADRKAFSPLAIDQLEVMLAPTETSAEGKVEWVKHRLLDEILTSTPVPDCYAAKLKQPQGGLFERLCACFAFELARDPTLHNLFEGRILAKINLTLADQQLTLADLQGALRNLAGNVPHLLTRLDDLELLIQERNNSIDLIDLNVGQVLALTIGSSDDIAAIRRLLEGLVLPSQSASAPTVLPSTPKSPFPPNPFLPLTGRIDDLQQVFGREREINTIFELLNNGSSVAVIGEREIGKSSLLRAIEQQAEHRLRLPRQPIYLNLQSIDDDNDFFAGLCEQLGIATCRGLALERALKSRHVLLLLDELEQMTWTGFTRRIREQLRALAEGQRSPLKLVLAASTSLDRLFPDSEGNTSPIQGICLEERLNPWNAQTMQQFIETRLSTTPVRFTPEDMRALVQTSQGYPKRLMKACHDLYRHYTESTSSP
jgi:type II secretory pathway predicted ATPase ExeA